MSANYYFWKSGLFGSLILLSPLVLDTHPWLLTMQVATFAFVSGAYAVMGISK